MGSEDRIRERLEEREPAERGGKQRRFGDAIPEP